MSFLQSVANSVINKALDTIKQQTEKTEAKKGDRSDSIFGKNDKNKVQGHKKDNGPSINDLEDAQEIQKTIEEELNSMQQSGFEPEVATPVATEPPKPESTVTEAVPSSPTNSYNDNNNIDISDTQPQPIPEPEMPMPEPEI